jgi:hypothetical protein
VHMPAQRYVQAEFAFEPRTSAALDALYVARPEHRGRIAALLGASVAGMVLGVGAALTGAHLLVWAACLLLAALALAVLGWWALTQCHGSLFSAGPGTAFVDDHGLLVRVGGGHPVLLPWSTLRGWAQTEKVIVLLPHAGRPLHVIMSAAVEAAGSSAAFRELLVWHLGQPKH